ncbi:Calmodulin binding protein PICBP [Sesamum alatum]|uniref:Calmodulin binding protein PICBP n=1 Tax=Sesamum alatum TaxID=300844 RepID=A0AAE2CJX0_9LAMI|nr:Calmodulin binding protein PICBP [Sesamum alatum]
MVQRKLPAKLSLRPDHLKAERNLFHHQDLKPRCAADLTKKMKKSGSFKQPGKPPPPGVSRPTGVVTPRKPSPVSSMARTLNCMNSPEKSPPGVVRPTGAVTPQKPSPGGSLAGTPNYMKPTTSSDARKEVSTRSPQTSPESSSLERKGSKNLKLGLGSGTKATKTMSRTSSLKMMRTLTKNPSFKPARASVRKCSPVVLCENLDAQRATCSSTLKDCKFPDYLSLNPGGTEAEGTSAVKVCPYTYCSLNGHKHAPVPPLKCFLSARRRMIKNQRGLKLGCLSPRRVKCIADGVKFDDKLVMQDALKSSGTSLLRDEDEEETDFFVEIFSKEKGDTADYTGIDGSDATAAEDQEEWALEGLSDAMISYDVDADETVDGNGDADSMDVGRTCSSEENHEVEVDEGVSPPFSVQGESTPKVQFHELDSEASDMDWETGHHSALYVDYDYEYSPEMELAPDPEAGEVENHVGPDKFIVESDNKGDCFDEFLADDVSQESFDEEGLNTDAFSSSSDSESTGSYEYLLGSNNMETSATGEVPPEEPEPAFDAQNRVFSECNQTPRIGFHQVTGQEVSEGSQVQTELPDEDLSSNTENKDDSAEDIMTLSPVDPEKEPGSEFARLKSTERGTVHKGEAGSAANQETEDSGLARALAKCKKQIEDGEELGAFNPRAPNFLPVEPDPEAEKVDLRHQDLDERKNAEEWMVDYALRQAVTKLAPARKRKHSTMQDQFRHAADMITCRRGRRTSLLKEVSKQDDLKNVGPVKDNERWLS